MITLLDYEDLSLLNRFGYDFPYDSCFDYIDSIIRRDDGKIGIIVFVEPCGDIVKWGDSILDVLTWWKIVFEKQPNVSYCEAGWWLYEHQTELPDNPDEVWKGIELMED